MPIIAAYPNSVASFTDKFDFTDVVFAAHINALQAEVAALETIIGTLPQGTAATVKARIQSLEDGIAVLNGHFDSGGLIPQSGVNGLVAALAGKALTGHTHVDADITDLGSANVYHAIIADNATHATNADNATNAGHATNADNATNATHATNADNATNASHATNADNATNAGAVPWSGITSRPVTQMRFGQVFIPAASIDSSGRCSFAHGMSPQPSSVVITHYTGGGDGGAILFTVRSITSTQVNIRAWDGTTAYSPSTGFNLYWLGLE